MDEARQARLPRKLLRRWEGERDVRFLTFSCFARLPLFSNDAVKRVFVDRLAAVRGEQPFALIAWVVMPEHAHLILLPEVPVSEIMRSLKRPVAERVIHRWRELNAPILRRLSNKRGQARFWQVGGGYDRNIRDDRELDEAIDYVHHNPVARGLVDRDINYPWSSARWYEGVDCVLECDRIDT
jgi:putative transposase